MISNLLSLKQLEAFVWVADLGSFRKAAHHLGTTQPNISSRIAGLEASLDVVLMIRDAGSVRMTDKGIDLLQAARKILRDADEFIAIAGRPDLIEDRLRLGVTELVACTWLHAYLRKLKHLYPGVAVELTVDLSRSLDLELSGNALDLTIQTAPFASSISGNIPIGAYDYVWAAAEQVTAGGQQLTVADLIPRTILTHARHTQAFQELRQYAQQHRLNESKFVPSSSMASCVQMATDGLGVTLLPRTLIDGEIAQGHLHVLDVSWTPSPLRFAARFHAEKAAGYIVHAAEVAKDVAAEFASDDKKN